MFTPSCDEFRRVVYQYNIGADTNPATIDFFDWAEPLAAAEKEVTIEEAQKLHQGCSGEFVITENSVTDEAVKRFKHYAQKIIKGNSA